MTYMKQLQINDFDLQELINKFTPDKDLTT